MDLLFLLTLTLPLGCMGYYANWVTRRRYPDRQQGWTVREWMFIDVFFVSYMVGWTERKDWHIQGIMLAWTFCWVGPLLVFLAVQLSKSDVAVWGLAVCSAVSVASCLRFANADRAVHKMWEDPNSETVMKVVKLGPRAIPHLLEAMDVGDANVRTAAADALRQLPTKPAPVWVALYKAAQDPDPILRQVAAEAVQLDPSKNTAPSSATGAGSQNIKTM